MVYYLCLFLARDNKTVCYTHYSRYNISVLTFNKTQYSCSNFPRDKIWLSQDTISLTPVIHNVILSVPPTSDSNTVTAFYKTVSVFVFLAKAIILTSYKSTCLLLYLQQCLSVSHNTKSLFLSPPVKQSLSTVYTTRCTICIFTCPRSSYVFLP